MRGCKSTYFTVAYETFGAEVCLDMYAIRNLHFRTCKLLMLEFNSQSEELLGQGSNQREGIWTHPILSILVITKSINQC